MRIMDNYNYTRGTKKFDFLPDDFPNELLSEQWADYVHGQTLTRLNERGGLSIMELLMNLKRISLNDMILEYGYNYKATEQDAKELLSFITPTPSTKDSINSK